MIWLLTSAGFGTALVDFGWSAVGLDSRPADESRCGPW